MYDSLVSSHRSPTVLKGRQTRAAPVDPCGDLDCLPKFRLCRPRNAFPAPVLRSGFFSHLLSPPSTPSTTRTTPSAQPQFNFISISPPSLLYISSSPLHHLIDLPINPKAQANLHLDAMCTSSFANLSASAWQRPKTSNLREISREAEGHASISYLYSQ